MQTLEVTTWKNEVPFGVVIEVRPDASQPQPDEAQIDAKIDKLFEATLLWIKTQSAVDISQRRH